MLALLLLAAACSDPAGADGENTRKTADAASEAVLFEQLPVVEAASLHTQTLREAPANVTLITAAEIRRYGYRTLGEALASVRGFFTSYDGGAYSVGVRGFALPGDYNTRFLVLINGHPMTDNVFGAMYMFGQDFGLDMDLVERIEVIRGPSSALYGSNGIFATINVITRSPVDQSPGAASVEAGNSGEKKVYVSSAFYLGRGANLLVSASGLYSSGREMNVPEAGRRIEGIGAEKGYHSFLSLAWRRWDITAMLTTRQVSVPTGWYGTRIGDPGTRSRDGHSFIDATYTRDAGPGKLQWRFYYDWFRYHGTYHYDLPENEVNDNRDESLGDWVGTKLTYQLDVRRAGTLILGAQADVDVRNRQRSFDFSPVFQEYLRVDRPGQSAGLFAQQEWRLSRLWTAVLGARLDAAGNHRLVVSPRAALVFRPSAGTAWKLMYGRGFRSPSAFEMFYDDNGLSTAANPALRPERVQSLEAAWEKRLPRGLELVATAYQYRLSDLIQGADTDDGLLQYRNLFRSHATGFEIEVAGRPWRDIETTAAVSFQRLRNPGAAAAFANSPRVLGYFRSSAPLAKRHLWLSPALRYIAARQTVSQNRLAGVLVADATASTERLHRDFDLEIGVRNLFDRRYADPLSTEHALETMPRAGRCAFVKLVWRWRE